MADTVSVVLMTLLALPFVLGAMSSSGTGVRVLIGLLIGLAYYVTAQAFANSGQVFDLDPGWSPGCPPWRCCWSTRWRFLEYARGIRTTRVPESRSCQHRPSGSQQAHRNPSPGGSSNSHADRYRRAANRQVRSLPSMAVTRNFQARAPSV